MSVLNKINRAIPIAKVLDKKQKITDSYIIEQTQELSVVPKFRKNIVDRPKDQALEEQNPYVSKTKNNLDEKLDKNKAQKNKQAKKTKTIDDKVGKVKKKSKIKSSEPDISYELKLLNDSYERHSIVYKQAMSHYLQVKANTTTYSTYEDKQTSSQTFFAPEVITYKEIKEVVRVIQMNALMHGEHNYVAPELKTSYKYWKWARKENEQISFAMHEGVFR